MMQLVTPSVPFPNIYWWLLVSEADRVVFDVAEHFVKMSYRNRYYITGANGLIQLSVPLAQGRNQRNPMQEVQIDNNADWQVQHWRTIFSVYGRAPYFEYYAPSLEELLRSGFDNLVAYNDATIQWAKEHTGINFASAKTDIYQKLYAGDAVDIRNSFKPGVERSAWPANSALYYQLFAERNGFYPNLSILDLLFSEGPAVSSFIREHRETIMGWQAG